MIEVSLFGWLVGTFASAASVLFFMTALASVAFLGVTLLSALAPGLAESQRRSALRLGAVAALVTLVMTLVGVRMGGFFLTLLVGVAAASAIGAVAACLRLAASRGLVALAGDQSRRLSAAEGAEQARARRLEAGRRRFLEGGDLREEVAEAQASLERLRSALQGLEQMHRELPSTPAPSTDAAAREVVRLRDELGLKIDLGRRVLAAAETSVFRLACFEPLRRLLRRRPQEATLGLSRASTQAELEERIERGVSDIEAFLAEIRAARASLETLERQRATRPPGVAAAESDAVEIDVDPLDRARSEIDAMETAYRAVLERARVVRLRLAARAGMEQVASAAGAVSESARTLGLDEGDLRLLLDEVARAESAMTLTAPDGADVRALTDALVRSAAALDRGDEASLSDLVKAMREME